MKTAAITGITGQLGSYCAEEFLNQGYKVFGLKRRSSSINAARLDHLYGDPNLILHYGDGTDYSSISTFVSGIKPDVFINCLAQSHVRVSFDIPLYTMEATGNSVLNCLEAIRIHSPKTSFITMSSSEMFGSTPPPQSETTPFHPRSVYAIAKLAGYYSTIHYREAYQLKAFNAICFNTESPRRGENFLTRKVVMGAVRCKLGLQDKLVLGNLDAYRDFSHAKDVVRGLRQIVESETPDDFVIASGETHQIRKFVETVFTKLDLDYKDYVQTDPKYLRATEVDALRGDATKIKTKLGWKPEYNLDMLIDEMIVSDMKIAKGERLLLDHREPLTSQ
jgi:GDPmannose 4,6-dehydratase